MDGDDPSMSPSYFLYDTSFMFDYVRSVGTVDPVLRIDDDVVNRYLISRNHLREIENRIPCEHRGRSDDAHPPYPPEFIVPIPRRLLNYMPMENLMKPTISQTIRGRISRLGDSLRLACIFELS